MNSEEDSNWLPIYDDILEIDELIFIQSSYISPYELSRALLALARLKVLIFELPRSQITKVIWSSKYNVELHELTEEIADSWASLDFPFVD